jgi:AcrR family transcriptional regulator
MPRTLTQAAVADFRDRLCHIAAQLFFEMGHDGFNMRELAKRAGVSAMTPYRYFKDKDEILASVRAHAFGRLADRLEAAHATPGVEKSIALTQAYVQFAQQEQLYYRLIFDLSRLRIETPKLELQERRVRGAFTKHACLLVDQEILNGDPAVIGQVLWSALHGVMALNLAGQMSDAETERVLSEAVHIVAKSCCRVTLPLDEWPVYPAPEAPMREQTDLAVLSAAE